MTWQGTRDLLVAASLVAGYAWLVVLTARVRAVHPQAGAAPLPRPRRHAELRAHIGVGEILRRERGTAPPMPPSCDRLAVEHTQPIPAVDHRPNRKESSDDR